jgi:toxin HigB-1
VSLTVLICDVDDLCNDSDRGVSLLNGYDNCLLIFDAFCATCYTACMIKTFKHKGLQRFYESGSTKGIQVEHSNKLRMQLTALNTATSIEDMNIPGYRLHELKGNRRGIWSVSVSGNWRITFEFRDGNAYILNYEDYH